VLNELDKVLQLQGVAVADLPSSGQTVLKVTNSDTMLDFPYLQSSRPLVQVLHILEVRCASYDAWKSKYESDPDFGEIWAALQNPTVINHFSFS
jgi:hypothetical protein